VEVVGGGASDPGFSRQAATDASVLYQCLNPPYHRWVELFPALEAGVLAAAEATEAKLVVMVPPLLVSRDRRGGKAVRLCCPGWSGGRPRGYSIEVNLRN
jgi:hypothetical protein